LEDGVYWAVPDSTYVKLTATMKKNDPNSEQARAAKAKGALDRQVQAHIGRKLKAVYDEVAAEPLPDKLVDLLARLDGKGE
jgi:hypothetical protein